MVVVGSALYDFPDRGSVINFLRVRGNGGCLNVSADPKDFGAKFVSRKPWDASSLEDATDLLEMFENLDAQNIDP